MLSKKYFKQPNPQYLKN